ncbi:DICT sensory domain-containing protein (plasmid) [Haloferax sp. S1W]|uniref:DICT sensory domain-containing protein n=1 Tax=Haloferax sp. S1W TaxID=3377110 RepID=UPI0037CA6772
MSLSDLIDSVAASEKTLTVFNPDGAVADRLAEHFKNRNLTVTAASSPHGPSNYAVLSTGETFHTAVAVEDLLVTPDRVEPGFEREPYVPILDYLDETLFTSYDRGQMLAATREIEDRAWRVGAGHLYAGFQTGENLREQLPAYQRLGDRGDLSVHAYAYPSCEVPPAETFQLHLARAEEIRTSWFVVYDGNEINDYKCALVAEEATRGTGFTGFWTYDPLTVDYLVDYLRTTYTSIESDGMGRRGFPSFPSHLGH